MHMHTMYLLLLAYYLLYALHTAQDVVSWADTTLLVATLPNKNQKHTHLKRGKNARDHRHHMLFAQLVLTVLAEELY